VRSRTWIDQLFLLLGQWFYSGRAKHAPGTIGSLATVPLFLLARQVPVAAYWALTVGLTLGGVVVSERCARILEDKDPSSVVIDEVAGVMIALGCVSGEKYWYWALAWTLFRILDIRKPWLIDTVQNLKPTGLGIMADDVLAGLFAGGIAWAGARLIAVLTP
jgi:phosphatidylglycerophosphatase A